jgi:acetylornithine deacetylase/succinyl-diaminopimelate desuccinylase-like protein
VLGRAEEILSDLVLTRSAAGDVVRPIVDGVTRRLRDLGMGVRTFGDADRPALLATRGEGGVVLSGHLDTVPIGLGWTRPQGEVLDGVMYGRGACDMKGGCAAILLATERLAGSDVPFAVCFTTDEETSMNGADAVASSGMIDGAAAVVIAEPSDFDIIVKEKGLVQFSMRTAGRSAHASMPGLGDNAIVRMVGLLNRLEDLQRIPDDTLGELTVCVDRIHGGTQVNVIPDECQVEVDSRYPPHMTTEDVIGLVRGRLEGLEYELDVMHSLEPVETDAGAAPVQALKSIVGKDARISSVPYATEMVMFKKGNPTLMVCGPGDPKLCHVLDERIAIADVARAADVYVRYCTEMAGV